MSLVENAGQLSEDLSSIPGFPLSKPCGHPPQSRQIVGQPHRLHSQTLNYSTLKLPSRAKSCQIVKGRP